MIKRKSWEEFRETGLLLLANQFLHIFGWAIVFSFDEDSKDIIEVYPARVKFRGFNNTSTDKAYRKISRFMKDNADELVEETEEEEDGGIEN